MATNPAMIHVRHLGGDRLGIEIRGHRILSDQPLEDGGDDIAPTPTELFLAGLSACVAFYGERFLHRHGLTAKGFTVSCRYTWAENPHRVGEIDIAVDAPGLTPEKMTAFERVIEHCTVHNTLRQPPIVRIHLRQAHTAAASAMGSV